MTKLLYLKQRLDVWWRISTFCFAAIVIIYLIAHGLHPVWGILLFAYRKAAVRVCLFLGLLLWLAHGIV